MPPPVLPPPPSGTTSAGLPPIRIDLTRLLAGNWLGSAVVALVMLATATALSAVLTLLAKPTDFGVDHTLTLGMMVLAASFGANVFFDGHIADEDLDVNLVTGTFPLTVTVVTLLAGVLAFRRMVRSYPSAIPALGDAARVALLTALPLFVGSLVFRSDLEDELGGGWIRDLSEELGSRDEGTWGASAPEALVVTFALVAFVLATTCLARRDWWPAKVRPVAEWLAPAIQGVALMVVLLPLCGLVGLGLIAFGPDNDNDFHSMTDDEAAASTAVIAGGLANSGQMLLGLGAGSELGASGEVVSTDPRDDPEESDEEFHRLAWFAGDGGEEPGLWAAPVILLVVLGLCAWWVASRSRERSDVVRNLGVWLCLLLAAVPWLTRLASLHGGADVASDSEEATGSGYVGLEGAQTTFFVFLVALAVAVVVALARVGFSAEQVRRSFGRWQVNPGGPPTSAPPVPPPSAPPSSAPPASRPPGSDGF